MGAVALGLAGAMGHTQNIVVPPAVETPAPPRPNPKKKPKVKKLRGSLGQRIFRPHQGSRECARRRGDWVLVSVIDAAKRYPYGINHRLPSVRNPDRAEVDFPQPDAETSRLILPRRP
jgi:hypothetical protein